VLGSQICEGLVMSFALSCQLLLGGLGDALGPGPSCVGFSELGFSGSHCLGEHGIGLGFDALYLGCVLGSEGL